MHFSKNNNSPDLIRVREISLNTTLAESPWPTIDDASLKKHPVLQPVSLSLAVEHDLRAAGGTDELKYSVNYSSLCKDAQRACGELGVGLGSGDNSGIALASNTTIDTNTTTTASHVDFGAVTNAYKAPTAYGLASHVLRACLATIPDSDPISGLDVELILPKVVLRAKNAYVKVCRQKSGKLRPPIKFGIKQLPVHCIIGIHPHERETKQPVCFDLDFVSACEPGGENFKFKFCELEERVSNFVEASKYLTVEALATEVARECLTWVEDPIPWTVSVTVSKPSALRIADAAIVCITRTLSDFPDVTSTSTEVKSETSTVAATLALGANLGDRFQNIELALRYLENFDELRKVMGSDVPVGNITISNTSFLYETAPMYVLDQPSFINCACLVETNLSAQDLLRVCKCVESAVGRVPSVRFGPRAVDVDIVTFGNESIDTRTGSKRASLENLDGELIVPHPRMAEREFVLRPLCDIIPNWVHPSQHLSVRSLLSKVLLAKSSDEPPMHKVIPFPVSPKLHALGPLGTPATQSYWTIPDTKKRHTYIMATLNVTPDSFSDGSKHNTRETSLAYVRDAVAAGADIIDIGGYSTRPGAAYVSPEEEIERVVPAIKAIREDAKEEVKNVLISVDTFRPKVAQAALEAGANCVNDVYAFSGPSYPPNSESVACFGEMRKVVRESGAPAIMMHARGEAGRNKDYSQYKSVLEGVRVELSDKVCRAVLGRGGIRRWQVIVDPGIGFSKSIEGNLELLRNISKLVEDSPIASSSLLPRGEQGNPPGNMSSSIYATPNWNPLSGYPVLIGTSRKSFLGKLLSMPRTTSGSDGTSTTVAISENVEPRPAEQRDFATAAAVGCAVQQGVAVIRVHEVQGMIDVVRIAEALYCL